MHVYSTPAGSARTALKQLFVCKLHSDSHGSAAECIRNWLPDVSRGNSGCGGGYPRLATSSGRLEPWLPDGGPMDGPAICAWITPTAGPLKTWPPPKRCLEGVVGICTVRGVCAAVCLSEGCGDSSPNCVSDMGAGRGLGEDIEDNDDTSPADPNSVTTVSGPSCFLICVSARRPVEDGGLN